MWHVRQSIDPARRTCNPEVTMTDDTPVTSKTDEATSRFRTYFTGGTFQPGAQLPSEAELVERFGISRTTVRRALDKLREQHVIETEHGKGSFVLDAKPAHTLTLTRDPWERLEPAGEPHPSRSRVCSLAADMYGLREGTPTFVREQAATHRDTGARVLTTRTVIVEPIMHIEPEPDPVGDRAELIAALDTHLGPLTTRIRTRYIPKPPADTAKNLGLEPGTAIAEIRYLTYGRDRRLLMIETIRTDATTAEWETEI
jgi:GntR family transcriptional regulator